MVLCLKTRESRSPPDPHNANPAFPRHDHRSGPRTRRPLTRARAPDQPHRLAGHPQTLGAGWSSPVARQAHNLKVTGSNPVPATRTSTCTIPASVVALGLKTRRRRRDALDVSGDAGRARPSPGAGLFRLWTFRLDPRGIPARLQSGKPTIVQRLQQLSRAVVGPAGLEPATRPL